MAQGLASQLYSDDTPLAMARRLALPMAEAMVRSASSCVVPYDSKAPVTPAGQAHRASMNDVFYAAALSGTLSCFSDADSL